MAAVSKEKKYLCTYPNCRRPHINLHEIFEHTAWYHCRASRENGCFEFKCTDVKCGGYFVSRFVAEHHVVSCPGHVIVPLPNERIHFKQAWREVNDMVDNYIVHKDTLNPNTHLLPVPAPPNVTEIMARASIPHYSNNGYVTPRRENFPGEFYSPAYARWNDLDRTPRGQRTPTRDRTPDWQRAPAQDTTPNWQRTPTRDRTPNWQRTPLQDRTPAWDRTPVPDINQSLVNIAKSPFYKLQQQRSSNAFNFEANRTPNRDTFHRREQADQCVPVVPSEALCDSSASTGMDIVDDNEDYTPPSPSAEEDWTPRSPSVSKEYTPRSPPLLGPEPKIGPALPPDFKKRSSAQIPKYVEMHRSERTIPSAPKSKEPKQSSPFRIRNPSAINIRETAKEQNRKTISALEKISAAIDAKKIEKATNRYGGGSVQPLVKTIDPIPLSPEKEVKRRGRGRSRTPTREKTPSSDENSPVRPPRSKTPTLLDTPSLDGSPPKSKTPGRLDTPSLDGSPLSSRRSMTPAHRKRSTTNEGSPMRSRRGKTSVETRKTSKASARTATKASRASKSVTMDKTPNRSREASPSSRVVAKDSEWEVSPIPYKNRLRDRIPSRIRETSGTGILTAPRRSRIDKSSSGESLIYCGGATPLYRKTTNITSSTPKTSSRTQRTTRSSSRNKENRKQDKSTLSTSKDKQMDLNDAIKLIKPLKREVCEEISIKIEEREPWGSPKKQIKVIPARKSSNRTPRKGYRESSSSPEPSKRRRLLSSSDSE